MTSQHETNVAIGGGINVFRVRKSTKRVVKNGNPEMGEGGEGEFI